MQKPTVYIVTGPTASGKTAYAIDLALRHGCEIVNADSRQLYRGLEIGTAAPTAEQRARVPHHLVGILDLDEYYSAACFAQQAVPLLTRLTQRDGTAVVCGGSMMYIDALTRGLDDLPTISDAVRQHVVQLFEAVGLEGLQDELRRLDPEYYAQVDLNNHRRVMHGVEICLEAGKPYSALRTQTGTLRDDLPFTPVIMALDLPREQLFRRINARVEQMMADGLLDEARRVYPQRHLNALNTVGYKELFAYFDDVWDLPTAVARIQKNTRVYAKKQLTWLRRYDDVQWLQA